jgi:benzoate membrane transport protein
MRPVLAGVVTALVGFGGAFPVVLAGLRAVGADERQAASGLLAVCLASGAVAVLLGLRTRMPVSIAWSTPGAALLTAAGPQPGGFAAAVGALAIVVTGPGLGGADLAPGSPGPHRGSTRRRWWVSGCRCSW